MEIGDGLEAIEEVAGRHALFASELEIKDFEPLVGGCNIEMGLLNKKHARSSGTYTTSLLSLENFHVNGSCGNSCIGIWNKGGPSSRDWGKTTHKIVNIFSILIPINSTIFLK